MKRQRGFLLNPFRFGGGGGGGGDPYWANVRLLLPGDSFTDLSDTNMVTPAGGVAISNDYPLFDRESYFFNGTGARIALSEPSVFAFGTDDFTFGWWSWRNASKADALIFSTSIDGSANGGYWLEYEGNNFTMYGPGSSLIIRLMGAGTYDSEWRYWEVTRSGDILRVFKQGVKIGETSLGGRSFVATNARVGGTETFGGFDGWHNGYLAQFRVDRGIARHTADFTPPDAPFPVGP